MSAEVEQFCRLIARILRRVLEQGIDKGQPSG